MCERQSCGGSASTVYTVQNQRTSPAPNLKTGTKAIHAIRGSFVSAAVHAATVVACACILNAPRAEIARWSRRAGLHALTSDSRSDDAGGGDSPFHRPMHITVNHSAYGSRDASCELPTQNLAPRVRRRARRDAPFRLPTAPGRRPTVH